MHGRPHLGLEALTGAPWWQRIRLLVGYADTDLLELFYAGLILVFAALSFYVQFTTDVPPPTTAYARLTGSPLFPWGCLLIGIGKLAAVFRRGLRLRLLASVPLTGLFTTLTVLVAALNLQSLGWTFFGYLAFAQAMITIRLAVDLGRLRARGG